MTWPTLAFERSTGTPSAGEIQFYDGYFPALPAGSYKIDVNQQIEVPGLGPVRYDSPTQTVVVEGPEFRLDPAVVHTAYPPAGTSDALSHQLPFVVLGDPELPWERTIEPGAAPDRAAPTPWLALLVFAEGEIELQPGSSDPVTTCTVAELLAPKQGVVKPALPAPPADVLASQCKTITIPGATFNAVMPLRTELPLLAHCRAVSSPDEGDLLLSVLIANRLPVADTRGPQPAALRYYAQLVSLEGFQDQLGPSPARPVPADAHVQLVTLYSWSFTSIADPGLSFKELMEGLIRSEAATPALRLPPATGTPPLPKAATDRLADGYAPLAFVSGAGERSFAWYRGPFTPVVPQPLPSVGDPPVEPSQATSADALMIYLADQGLFDLSYAAAWNMGRQLALADAQFAQSITHLRRVARAGLGRIAQGLAAPHLARAGGPAELLARDAARGTFARRVEEGLTRGWSDALSAARDGARPTAAAAHRIAPHRRRAHLHPRDVLGVEGTAEALAEHVAEPVDPVAKWLAKLSLLGTVPFSHLVPDPRMLPPESVRFFYVDQGWIDALVAGATSIAMHGTADVLVLDALRPQLTDATAGHRRAAVSRAGAGAPTGGSGMSGMLIRSQLVPGWPAMVVTASLDGAPLPVARDDTPSPSVRLCMFDGVPDEVTLAEPYRGLRFGLEDGGVVLPRCVTDPSVTGVQIANAPGVQAPTRAAASGAVGGVIDVASLAPALQAAAAVSAFSPAAKVLWNGAPLATKVLDAHTLTATVAAAQVATPGSASVTVADGTVSSSAVAFTVDPALAIDGLEPARAAAGGPGLTLAVGGRGFGADSVVNLNGVPQTGKTTVVSSFEVTAPVPAGLIATPGAGPSVSVTTGGRTSNAVALPVVGAGPALGELKPRLVAAGSPGFTLTIAGTGFGPDAQVLWGATRLATRFVDDTKVTAGVPEALVANPGSPLVTVTSGGLTSNGAAFTIGTKDPTIATLEPSVALTGKGAFQLAVDGINFTDGSKVEWNGQPLATTFVDGGRLRAAVPQASLTAAGTVAVTVRTGTALSAPASFVVIGPRPVIGLLEPSVAVAGSGDFTLTVTGGFGGGDFAIQMVAAPERQAFPSQVGP